MKYILIVFLIHILGGILYLIKNCINGHMKYAAKRGDGIRYAQPSDIVFESLFLWEFTFMFGCINNIENKINDYFRNKYKEQK